MLSPIKSGRADIAIKCAGSKVARFFFLLSASGPDRKNADRSKRQKKSVFIICFMKRLFFGVHVNNTFKTKSRVVETLHGLWVYFMRRDALYAVPFATRSMLGMHTNLTC